MLWELASLKFIWWNSSLETQRRADVVAQVQKQSGSRIPSGSGALNPFSGFQLTSWGPLTWRATHLLKVYWFKYESHLKKIPSWWHLDWCLTKYLGTTTRTTWHIKLTITQPLPPPFPGSFLDSFFLWVISVPCPILFFCHISPTFTEEHWGDFESG